MTVDLNTYRLQKECDKALAELNAITLEEEEKELSARDSERLELATQRYLQALKRNIRATRVASK